MPSFDNWVLGFVVLVFPCQLWLVKKLNRKSNFTVYDLYVEAVNLTLHQIIFVFFKTIGFQLHDPCRANVDGD